MQNNMSSRNANRTRNAADVFFEKVSDAVNAVIVMGGIELILILITQIALILVIVTSPPLRRKLRNQMLLSLAVVNTVTGVYTIPLVVEFLVLKSPQHGCLVHLTWQLLTEYVQNFVEFWAVVLLSLHYAASLRAWHWPPACLGWCSRHPRMVRAAGPLYALLPWLGGLGVVLPAVLTLDLAKLWAIPGRQYCGVYLSFRHRLAINIVTCFLPSVLIILLVAGVAVRVQRGWGAWLASPSGQRSKGRRAEEGSGEAGVNVNPRLPLTPSDDLDLDRDPALVHVLVGVLTVVLVAPVHAMSVYIYFMDRPSEVFFRLRAACAILEDLLPIAQAVLWLGLLPDLRARLLELPAAVGRQAALCGLVCGRCRAPPRAGASRTSVPPVTFTDLQDE